MLVEKYLMRDEPKFLERDERIEKMYKALARMDSPELVIFLLVVELGSMSEVARRLKVHRRTLTRIYHRIESKLRNDIAGLKDIG